MFNEDQKQKGYNACLNAIPYGDWRWIEITFKDNPLMSHVADVVRWECQTPLGAVEATLENRKWVFVLKNEVMAWGVLNAKQMYQKFMKTHNELDRMMYYCR